MESSRSLESIKIQIEVIRQKLNELIIQKEEWLIDPQIIEVSILLDQLIIEYDRILNKK